jgi:hypothetical protein
VTADFNEYSIREDRTVWFNSVLQATGIAGRAVTFVFSDTKLEGKVNGQSYTLPVPDGVVTFSPQAATATTTFDWSDWTWETVVPSSYVGNVFTTGVQIPVPFDVPGNLKGVRWSGRVTALAPGASLEWRWGAAVYSAFGFAAGVKPLDDGTLSAYHNSDVAGTPEKYTGFLVRGARGYGGTNHTGTFTNATGCQF